MAAKEKRVLIVDDAPFNRRFFKDIMKKSPFQVAGEAANGTDAVRMYIELQPDLVLMDIMMPGQDGIEASKRIVSLDPNARIIMCSTVSQESKIIEALQAGALDFIIKPIIPAKLLEAMQKVCQ